MILWDVWRAVRKVRKHIDLFYREVDGVLQDISAFRETVRENQFGLKPVFDAIKVRADAFAGKARRRKKTKAAKEKKETEPDTML